MQAALPSIDEISDNFQFLDDWEDRYKYLIDLGRTLPPYPDEYRLEPYKVRGCASQVWLHTQATPSSAGTVLNFQADSDAHIVRGLIAVLLALFNGKTARQILDTDAEAFLRRFQLQDHLTSQRANGLASMLQRIRAEAQGALA